MCFMPCFLHCRHKDKDVREIWIEVRNDLSYTADVIQGLKNNTQLTQCSL